MPVDDDAVVYCAASESFVDLADSAAELWHVLDRVDWLEQAAVDHLRANYRMDTREAELIVRDFAQTLHNKGVLSENDP